MKKSLIVFLIALLSIPSLSCAVPQLVNFQGMLTTNAGTPVTGPKSMIFSLYSTTSGGAPLWSEAQTVNPANGIYSVALGAAVPIPASVFAGDSLYLGVAVDDDSEMVPRQSITSVAFTFRAGTADTVADGAVTSAKIADGAVTADKIDRNQVQTKINASCPTGLLMAGIDTSGGLICVPPSVTAATPLSGSGTSASPLGIAIGTSAGTVAAGNDPRLSDARDPLPGSASYIQNGTTPQGASFNISGDGTIGGNLNIGGQIIPLRAQSSASPPAPASAANAGRLYFDTATGSLMLSDGASWAAVGARRLFHMTGSIGDETDNGFVSGRSLSFTKVWPTSELRITYSDNMRVASPNACQWEVYLDGNPLAAPLKTALYNDTGLTHRQSTLVGYATGIAAGTHTMQVKVSSAPGYAGADCYTGWQSTYLLEVEELP